jgi:hypothetical protein
MCWYKGYEMKFLKAMDIQALDEAQRKRLQVGQWVYAGNKSCMGKFLGVKRCGTVVVAWQGNAAKSGDVLGYWHDLLQYARGRS